MANDLIHDLIHDRGRGPEIVGTRITVYNLLPHFLDATATEAYICRVYELTPEQVAAARAYILNNADAVLTRHLEIEAQISAGNPPEVIERAKQTHAAFLRFKDWLANRKRAEARENADKSTPETGRTSSGLMPTFRKWLEEESRSNAGS
jgi:uncharacterized protein (DUF433 family)